MTPPSMAAVVAAIAILGTFASSITYLVQTADAAESAAVTAEKAHKRIDDFAENYSAKQSEFVKVQQDVAVLKQKSITAEKDRTEIKAGLKELLRRTPAR